MAGSSAIESPRRRSRFKRDFVAVDQRDDDLAVLGGLAALDQHGVAIEDAGVDHAVAGDFERVVLAAAEQAGGYVDAVALSRSASIGVPAAMRP